MSDGLNLKLSMREKLIGRSNKSKERELHILNFPNRLKNISDIIAIGSIMILIHPQTVHSKK
jgi:hypothetical protein